MFKFLKLLNSLLKVLTKFWEKAEPEYFLDKLFVVLRDNLSLRDFGEDVIDDKTEVLYDLN